MGAEKESEAAANHEIGGHDELRKLNSPENGVIEEETGNSREKQDSHHDENQIHASAAHEAVDAIDVMNIRLNETTHMLSLPGGRCRFFLSTGTA